MSKRPEVCVVGVGALGSHLVQFIRNEAVDVKVIDMDRVEQKNVASQFHGKPGVGKSKVAALQQTMDFLFKRPIATISNKLVAANIDVILKGASLVVDCLDNGTSRKLVQDHARARGLPCLHGALAPGGAFGRSIWDEHFVVDSEVGGGRGDVRGRGVPALHRAHSGVHGALGAAVPEGRDARRLLDLSCRSRRRLKTA